MTPRHPFPIVGIGASAGGLDAFRRLLGALPTDTGMAYVLVQHLDPHHESILADLLSHSTAMAVAEVKGDVPVEPNRVYVIPPSEDIVLSDGMLKLVPRSRAGTAHMPVDSFLRSLAAVQGSRSIGVILSGLASDGTLGLKAIKAEGGITFAQDPLSARHDGMPRSAIAAGCVDSVLPPEAIARELRRLGRHPYVAAVERGLTPAVTPDAVRPQKEDGLEKILLVLRKASGADFSAYKKTTLHRRVARRMALNRIETLEEYARSLEGDAAEAHALYQDCLISVTSFFRDREAFEALSERVVPVLLQERRPASPVRIWVPGCATGEEVYSIAICLLERAGATQAGLSFQIFATDLAESVLKTARAGIYLENIAQEVAPERLQRFFTRVDGHYQISKTIREMCVFARHDLARDPPFSRMDLISCRNVLIYVERRLQERIFATFHYALSPSGFLMLGPAEGVSAAAALFSPVDEKHRIYSRKAPVVPAHFQLTPGASFAGPVPREAALIPEAGVRSEPPKEADRMLLARYGPASVVVDEGLDILEFRGDTDPFLEHTHGQASLNLIQMARKGLLVELRQAVQEARKKGAASRKEGLRIRYRGQLRNVSLEVIPIKGRAAAERCLLVLFETQRVSPPAEGRGPAPARLPSAKAKDREIAGLKQKLVETAEYSNTVAQEHAAALEELQSTNEEALSSNEELQSVNEELQTAKEEIQSANEELSTLNQELQDRNFELGQANDDLWNLLGSVNIPIVMVGRDLRLRRFTAAAETLFGLIAPDVGRPLGDLRTHIEAPELAREVREVIDTVRASEREIRDQRGRFYVMRIRPYLTREHKVDGAVVVLLDVDALKRSAEEVRRALDAASAIVATVREPLLILDGELRVEKANRAYYQAFHVLPEATEGRLFWQLGNGQWERPDLRAALDDVLAGDGSFEDFEVEHEIPEVGRRTMALNARRLHHERGGEGRILLAIVDRTEAKRAEERRELLLAQEQAARERAEAADQRKDELVATVSHELRAPLTTIGGWVYFLSEGKLDQATLASALAAMGRSVKTQERLIADLLDQSRIAFGQIRLSRDPLDLVATATAAIESVRAAAEAKSLQIELSGDHVGSVVVGDADRMQQVLWNLLFNAVKFTPPGGRVQVGIGTAENAVELTVSDSGDGIPADALPHLFQGFRRREGPAHRQAGLGLGLKLVRELVELHGGTVRAESAGEGHGATFRITLPTAAAVPAEP